MKFKFTIGRKIGFGFGTLIVFTLLVFLFTKRTLDSGTRTTNTIIKKQSPSVDALQEVKILILTSKMLITNWVSFQADNHPDKIRLITVTDTLYPKAIARLDTLSQSWSSQNRMLLGHSIREIEDLFATQDIIKMSLPDFKSYDDPQNWGVAEFMIGDNGDVDIQTDNVLKLLDTLIERQRISTKKGSDKMIKQFDLLEFVVTYLGIALCLGGVLIAFFTVRAIVKPVYKLKTLLLLMGKGIIPKEKMEPSDDEIGEMSFALNDLVLGFKSTANFAKEIGAGNFKSEYTPLSENDSLGHSLLAMRESLHELTSNLEAKVEERTAEVVKQKEEIEGQKEEIEELLKEVTDSIVYAQRIQDAILPSASYVNKLLPDSFVLFKPKDIVSGDFYWMNERDGKVVFAAMDCTGHGVPGALMTIVGYNKLNQSFDAVPKIEAASILDGLNQGVMDTFNQGGDSGVKDGMDAAMCVIDFKKMELQFAGAYNPLYLIRNGELQETKGDKFPIGNFIGGNKKFTNHKLKLQKGDTIYVFSDGYPDQFGGAKGKKFMYRKFRDLILSVQDKKMNEQKEILNTVIEKWRGDLEQVDDILIMGIRV